MSQDVLSSLDTIRTQLRKRLLQIPEYRAMLSIERAISEVFDIMGPGHAQRPDPHEMAPEPMYNHVPVSAPEPANTQQAVTSVLESIAAKAVNSVAARNGMPTFAPSARVAQGGRG